MERRSLLRQIALGTAAGAAASSFGIFRAPDPAFASGDPGPVWSARRSTLPTGFTQGTVLSRDASGLLVTNERYGMQQVRVSATTTVWREIETSWSAIEAGDFLYVQGRELPGQGIEATRIWANIGWYRGTIADVGQDRVSVFLGRGSRTVYMTALTLLFHAGLPAAHYSGQLAVGQRVEALGMFVPGGDMRATRMWIQ